MYWVLGQSGHEVHEDVEGFVMTTDANQLVVESVEVMSVGALAHEMWRHGEVMTHVAE